MTQTCRHCGKKITTIDRLEKLWVHWKDSDFTKCGHLAEPAPEVAGYVVIYEPKPEPDLKHLLRTLFPVAWKADRGRQDPELMAAYVEVQKVLGLTKEEIEKLK